RCGLSAPWSLAPWFLCLSLICATASAPSELHPLSLHDALPILKSSSPARWSLRRTSPRCAARSKGSASPSACGTRRGSAATSGRSEEHTSELQSRFDLVCRLLLEKKNEPRHGYALDQCIPSGVA